MSGALKTRTARPVATAAPKNSIPSWEALGLPKPRHWPAGTRCECVACGEWFSTDRNFLKHRILDKETGTRRCAPPAALDGLGLTQNPQGIWVGKGSNPHARED